MSSENKEEVTVAALEEPTPVETEQVEESELSKAERTLIGDRQVALNSEAIASEQPLAETEKEAKPAFFVDEGESDGKTKIEVDVLTSKQNGKVLSVARKDLGIDYKTFPNLNHSEVWFEFSTPDYMQLTNYRQRSGRWHDGAQQVLVDKLNMRCFFLTWHLKDWSVTDSKGEKVELTFDKDGSLSKESVKRVYSVHPTILDVVMTVFEKDVLLGS